jgi:hypothetical protein
VLVVIMLIVKYDGYNCCINIFGNIEFKEENWAPIFLNARCYYPIANTGAFLTHSSSYKFVSC